MSCTKHLSRIDRSGTCCRGGCEGLTFASWKPYRTLTPSHSKVGLLTFRWRQLDTGLRPGAEHTETFETIHLCGAGRGSNPNAQVAGASAYRPVRAFCAPLIFHGRGQARPTRLQLGFRLLPSPPTHAAFRNLSLSNGSLFFSM